MPSLDWSLPIPSILGEVVKIGHNLILSSVRRIVGTSSRVLGGVFITEDFLVNKESFCSRSLELQGVLSARARSLIHQEVSCTSCMDGAGGCPVLLVWTEQGEPVRIGDLEANGIGLHVI
ncbi:UNVERIFIED_CONTAM: hypothetical protein Slati_2940800 [Sesamum latifolium]|uniref:Uncharacterized protein n=1 Tax=Sesamum latifolium TaxID=2727402 RepID=A0AAW2VDI6_9LAMI